MRSGARWQVAGAVVRQVTSARQQRGACLTRGDRGVGMGREVERVSEPGGIDVTDDPARHCQHRGVGVRHRDRVADAAHRAEVVGAVADKHHALERDPEVGGHRPDRVPLVHAGGRHVDEERVRHDGRRRPGQLEAGVSLGEDRGLVVGRCEPLGADESSGQRLERTRSEGYTEQPSVLAGPRSRALDGIFGVGVQLQNPARRARPRHEGGRRIRGKASRQRLAVSSVQDARAVLEDVPSVAVETRRVRQGVAKAGPAGAEGKTDSLGARTLDGGPDRREHGARRADERTVDVDADKANHPQSLAQDDGEGTRRRRRDSRVVSAVTLLTGSEPPRNATARLPRGRVPRAAPPRRIRSRLSTPSQFALAARGIRLFARPNARRVCLTLALALAVAVASAYEPLLLKLVVDRLVAAGSASGGTARHALVGVIAIFAAVLAGRILGAAWVTTSSCAVRLNMEYQLRARVAAKLSVLSSKTHGEIGTGGLRYAVDESAPQTARAFSDVAFRLLPMLAYVAVAAWGMSRLDGAIAAAVLCLAPIPALVALAAKRIQAKRDRMLHGFWIRVWSGYTELLNGMGTVRAFGMERVEERRLMRRMKWAFSSIQRGVHIDARVTVAAGLAELAARVVVLTLGGVLVVRGELTVGALLAFLGYVGGVFSPIQQIVDLYPTARKAGVALESVFNVLDAEEEAPDVAGAVPCAPIRGEIRFEGVRFGYRANHTALDDFDVTVAPGETVALVGPSGSGKSTVFRLLHRVHNPNSGRVLIDGQDLRTLAIATVRQQFGVVPQDVVLFNDSVAANIAYGRPTAPRAEVMAAAMAANAHGFIISLPDGYDTKVGEGGRALSGGQRQRLAIARAFLMRPAVLLFDEATAALDTESEQAVQDALRTFRRGRTTFIIAHRLNTVRDADRILVVSEGRIVGDGRHEALVASCPEYARLVRHQLGVEAAEETAPAADADARDAAASEPPPGCDAESLMKHDGHSARTDLAA